MRAVISNLLPLNEQGMLTGFSPQSDHLTSPCNFLFVQNIASHDPVPG